LQLQKRRRPEGGQLKWRSKKKNGKTSKKSTERSITAAGKRRWKGVGMKPEKENPARRREKETGG